MEKQLSIMNMTHERRRKVRAVATIDQRIEILEKLRNHLVKREDGSWVYESGYNDTIIAKMVDPSGRLTHASVSRVRSSRFGKLIRRSRPAPVSQERKLTLEDLNKKLNLVLERLAEIDKVVKTFV